MSILTNWLLWRHDVVTLFLLLTLMAAPTNISFATAIDIGTSLPYATTQQVDDAGTTYTVWYKYTAQADETEISVFGYGGTSYTATVTFWLDASTQYLNNNAVDRPSQIPVTSGTTYAFKFSPPGGNPSPANLSVSVELGGQTQLATGQIAINDSTDGYPVVVMDPTTAEPISFHHPFAAGEGVQVLQSGIVCAVDAFNTPKGPRIYNQDLTLIHTPTMPATNYTTSMGSNQKDTFWALSRDGSGANSLAVTVAVDGTVGTPLDLGADSATDVQPQADNTAVYWIRGTEIKKTTNPGGVMTLFKTVDAGFSFGHNLLMMTDDTLLVAYRKAATTNYVRRFNLAGVEQTGSPYSLTGFTGVSDLRIFADPSDPAYFWVWWQDSLNNYFRKVKVSDGSMTTAGPWPKFIEGDYQDTASATPTARFGADFSCVPWIIRGTTTTQTFPIRRQRRFLLPSSEDNKTVQIPVIELLMRTGIGLTPGAASDPPVQGSDPQVMIRLSKDGGKTWSPERWVSAGQIGRYKDRVRLLRATGNYRNAVLEVTVSDPVDWQFLAALAPNGIIEGSS